MYLDDVIFHCMRDAEEQTKESRKKLDIRISSIPQSGV